MSIKYRTHVSEIGWQPEFENGAVAGTLGQCLGIEAIELNITDTPDIGITYQVHVQDIGWMDPVINGQTAGTTGQNKHIEAIVIDLFGPDKDKYDVIYRCHVEDLGWLDWCQNGAQSGTVGGNKRLEALQVYFVPKNSVYFQSDQSYSSIDLTPPPQPEPAPTPQPSEGADSKRARVVATAQSYIGYVGSGNYSIFGDRYGAPYEAWCANFDRSVFADAGLSSLCPPTGYCPDAVNWFRNHQTAYFYRRGNYTPRNGDIIYFDYNGNGTPDHTGIVEGCDGSTVTTIEGNTGSPAQVKRKHYSVGYSGIYGYGVPAY